MKTIIILMALLAIVPTLIAQPHLSGPLSGTMGPGLFLVDSTITISAGQSLTLMPGTSFKFTGWFAFEIHGALLAIGSVQDSIKFYSEYPNINGWKGIRFDSTAAGCEMSFCRISGGKTQTSGGGIYCHSASPVFDHCLVSNCSAWDGGGAYFALSSAVLNFCKIENNSADDKGGGLMTASCNLTIQNTTINMNAAPYGAGIYLTSSLSNNSGLVANCLITNNQATGS